MRCLNESKTWMIKDLKSYETEKMSQMNVESNDKLSKLITNVISLLN